MKRILFLDIDGVLNDHIIDSVAKSATILPRCVKALNRVIDATDCRVVLVSAWRYMVLMDAMTVRGMEYLLRTHGLWVNDRLVGVTRVDCDPQIPGVVGDERARQVQEWLQDYTNAGIETYAAIDDMDFGYTKHGIPLVLVENPSGMTEAHVDALIRILS